MQSNLKDYKAVNGYRIYLSRELDWLTFDEAENIFMDTFTRIKAKLDFDAIQNGATTEQAKQIVAQLLNDDLGAMSVFNKTIKERNYYILNRIIKRVIDPTGEKVEFSDVKELMTQLKPQDGAWLLRYAGKLYDRAQQTMSEAKKK